MPIRWVVSISKQALDGENQPIKACVCIRGDLKDGKESVRAVSPTAGKETLKLALIIAANGGFEVKRLFYLLLAQELSKIGLHKVHADGALFTYLKYGNGRMDAMLLLKER